MVACMTGKSDPELCLQECYATLEPQWPTYPEIPAPHGDFGDRTYRYHIGRGNDELIPRPIAIALHVPEGLGNGEHFTEQLLREIELLAPLFDRDRDVVRLRWTGAADQLDAKLTKRVFDSISRHFHIPDTAEFSYRVDMDAAAVDSERLTRSHEPGLHKLAVRLTFGLAPQSQESLLAALRLVCDASPDSIDLVDGALMLPRQSAAPAMDAGLRLALLEHAVGQLQGKGYAHVYKDSFAPAGPNGVSFGVDQVGLGPGALSFTGGGVCQNAADISEWQSSLNLQQLPVAHGRSLTREERRRTGLVQALLRGGKVDVGTMQHCFAEQPDCLEKLRYLETCELVKEERDCIAASSRGRYLWRILAQCFDPDFNRSERAVTGGGPDLAGRQRGLSTQ